MSKMTRLFLAVAALTVSLVVLGAGISQWIEFPGGMSSTYRAGNNDSRLTSIAVEARPVIEAIRQFWALHGTCPDAATIAIPGSPVGWDYLALDSGHSCELWRKLGWDPSLVWNKSTDGESWRFVPGDGSDDIPLTLHP